MQGSVPKAQPAPSGLYIPEPMHFDFAPDFPRTSNMPSVDLHEGHAALPGDWQPQFTWQGQVELPAWYQTGIGTNRTVCKTGCQHSEVQNMSQDPFRCLPVTAFEQQPNAAMLTDGYNSCATQQQQQQYSDASMQGIINDNQQVSENTAPIQQSNWQVEVITVRHILNSMQQRPAWNVRDVQGNASWPCSLSRICCLSAYTQWNLEVTLLCKW